MLSVEAVGAIFVGLSALMTAMGGLLAARSRRSNNDMRDYRILRRQYRLARRHLFRLEVLLESKGIEVPAHPDGMDDEDDIGEKALT